MSEQTPLVDCDTIVHGIVGVGNNESLVNVDAASDDYAVIPSQGTLLPPVMIVRTVSNLLLLRGR
jgi:hypothetical protein